MTKCSAAASELIATEHADPDAIGVIDETGTAKSGNHTVGVKRQYNGNRGKIENCGRQRRAIVCHRRLSVPDRRSDVPAQGLGQRSGTPKKNYIPDDVRVSDQAADRIGADRPGRWPMAST